MKFTIGTDPEFFLYDPKTRKYVSAHDKVPGDKKNPSPLPNGGAVQADGTAVEFNIPACENGKQFKDAVLSALNDLRKMIPAQYKFMFQPSITYDVVTWKTIPDSAKELGCDPDWKVINPSYGSLDQIFKKNEVSDPGRIRTGSGHIHLGWTNKEDTSPGSAHFKDCLVMIYNVDHMYQSCVRAQLGDWYSGRENFYGAPGAFRCKPYGAELRTPSNKWLNYPDMYQPMANAFLDVAKKSVDGIFANYYNIYPGPIKAW